MNSGFPKTDHAVAETGTADTHPAHFSYRRYLTSKTTVDDRALNKDVVAYLRAALREQAPAHRSRIVELGSGIGTMATRVAEWDLVRQAEYTLLDADGTLVAEARTWVTAWAAQKGWLATATGPSIQLSGPAGQNLTLHFVAEDLHRFLKRPDVEAQFDVVVANAVLDLVSVPSVLPDIMRVLNPGGMYWFSVNFDGETLFEPAHRHDSVLMAAYHRSMDERIRDGRKAGDSKTGRHLFGHLREVGAHVVASGASDWVVFASNGAYVADEAYFLKHIIFTIEQELVGRTTEFVDGVVAEWVATRRAQIERGDLLYLAHQLDVAGRCPG